MPSPDIESYLQGTRNIMDYGAIGNGFHDDGPAINAAAAHGGVVYFPPPLSHYAIGTRLSIPSNTRLEGPPGGVTLKPQSGYGNKIINSDTTGGNSNIQMANLIFDAAAPVSNVAGVSTLLNAVAVLQNVDDLVLENVQVKNGYGHGILLYGCDRPLLINPKVTDCNPAGIALINCTHGHIVAPRVYDNSKATNGYNAYPGISLSGCTDIQIVAPFCTDTRNTPETAPGALTAGLAGAGAGNVDDGDHYYKVTLVTANGETKGGTASAVLTVTDKTTDGQVSLSSIPTGTSGVCTARKIYRTVAGGSAYLLLATISDNTTTTYTDNIADASLGAAIPVTNHSGKMQSYGIAEVPGTSCARNIVIGGDLLNNLTGDVLLSGPGSKRILTTSSAGGATGITSGGGGIAKSPLSQVILEAAAAAADSVHAAITLPASGTLRVVGSAYAAATISFYHGSPDGDAETISDSAAGFGTTFQPGDTITISGSVSNDGNYTVIAANASLIRVAEALTTEAAGATVTISKPSGNTDPDVYRCLSITGNQAGIVGDVVIEGTDWAGSPVTDTIALNGTATVDGVQPMKTVIAITVPERTSAGDTVTVGCTDILGLYRGISGTADVLQVARRPLYQTAEVQETVGTANVTYDTIAQAVAITAGDSFRIDYLTTEIP